VLGATDLVSKAQLEPFRKGVAAENFTRSLYAMLWGEGDMSKRFSDLAQHMSMLWPRVPWTVITAPLALVHPKEHVCVKPSVFTKQADCTTKPIRPTKLPTARVYRGYLEMCIQLREKLSDAGALPHDLLDVYDFIWVTQRPAAAEHLARVRAEGVLGRAPEIQIEAAPTSKDDDAEEAEAEEEVTEDEDVGGDDADDSGDSDD